MGRSALRQPLFTSCGLGLLLLVLYCIFVLDGSYIIPDTYSRMVWFITLRPVSQSLTYSAHGVLGIGILLSGQSEPL